MEHILVTGGDGLLAYQLKRMASKELPFTFLNRAQFELTNPAQMAKQLADLKPNIVINTAAYNLVEHCEVERDLSWAINATGPEKLASLCAENRIHLVHYSTDYVFDGVKKSPYIETDVAHPVNHYAAGKLAGEEAVLRAASSHLVLRTSWVFDWHPSQTKTFVHTIVKSARSGKPMKSATDQASVPTFASDLAEWTLTLLKRGAAGLFHAVNDEGVSRYDWARCILAEAAAAGLIASEPPLEPVSSSFFNSKMRRPDYTILNNQKLSQALGRPVGTWRPGLRKMLAQMN